MLEAALDELYGVEPGEFTATRNALRDRLRDAGDADAAKELARARRPTTAAWALNRLAREHADLIDDVIDRTHELAAAQARASPGQADEMREVTRERRDALAAAADAAVTIVGRITDNPATYRDPIVASLEAGSLDKAGAAALRAGRHVKEVTGPVGFPGTAPARSSLATRRAPKARARANDGATAAAPQRDREHERAEARREAAEAEDAGRAAAEQAEEAARAFADAEERVDRAEAALEQARDELQVAKRDARDARATAQRLERAAAAAAKAADAARRRADETE